VHHFEIESLLLLIEKGNQKETEGNLGSYWAYGL